MFASTRARIPQPWKKKLTASNDEKSKGPGPRPFLLSYRSSKWFIIFTVAMATFTDIFLYAIIVPVFPFALQSRVGIPEDNVQSWISILVGVYGGTLALSSPICGWAADRISSRRLPLILGLLALAGSTVLLNVGSSIGVLIVGRILQGISAAVVWVVGLALVADTVGKVEVATSMGYVFIGTSLGFLLGPLLGGIVFERAGYNAVFAICYSLIGVDIALRLLLIEKKTARKWEDSSVVKTGDRQVETSRSPPEDAEKRFPDLERNESDGEQVQLAHDDDSHRAKLDSDGMGDVEQRPEIARTRSVTVSIASRKIRLPPVITLLKSLRLLSALWASMVMAIVLTQFDSTLPLYVEEIFGWNSTGAGLIFLPIVIPSFLGPLVGFITDRYGGRWLATTAFILIIPCETCLRFVDHDSIQQKVLLCALLALIGLFINMVMTPIMAEIMLVVAAKEEKKPGLFGSKGAYAQAYGLFNLAFAIGCLVGPLWGGYVRESSPEGWGTLGWSMAVLAAVSVVPTVIWTDGSIFKKRRARRESKETSDVPAV